MNEDKLEKDSTEEKEDTQQNQDNHDEKLKEILDVLNKLENGTQNDGEKPKKGGRSFVLDFSPFIFRNHFLNVLLHLTVNLVIGLLIFAYLNVARYDRVVDLLYFIIYFSSIEYIVRVVFATRFIEVVIVSMGTIFFFLGLVILGITNDIFPEVYFYNFNSILVFALVLYISRFIIISPIKKIIRTRQINKFFGGMKKW